MVAENACAAAQARPACVRGIAVRAQSKPFAKIGSPTSMTPSALG